MTEQTVNPLPAFNIDDVDDGERNWAALALCVLDIETRRCIYCGQRAVFDTYAEYVAHFWAFEFEGDPWHGPDDEDDFDKNASLCLATPDDVAEDSPIAAPRDWNDESRTIVATYASTTAPGYALNVEDVDSATYRPYSRTSAAVAR